MNFERSFDPKIFTEAFINPEDHQGVDAKSWLSDERNYMFVAEDGSVGLLSHNYPGVGTVHWFFKEGTRGRKAIELARAMLGYAFDHGLVVARGITEKHLRAARWGARQVGMVSQGFVDWPGKGECELFTMTKEQYEGINSWVS